MEMYSTDLFRHTSGYATHFGPAREDVFYRSDSSENLQGLYNRPLQPAAAPIAYAWQTLAPVRVPPPLLGPAPEPAPALPPIWPGPGAPQRLDFVVQPYLYAAGDPRYAGVALYRVEDGQGGYQELWLKVPQPLPGSAREAQAGGSRRSLFARALRSLVCGSRRAP